MKKLVWVAICIFFVVSSFSQEKQKEEIPAAAKSGFAAKYPNAGKVKWSIEKPGEYEAKFKLNGTEMSATFDSQGKLTEQEVEIKEGELPQLVKAAIVKDFAGYKIDEVEKSTDAKGTVSYEMDATKGKEKYEISFDSNGKLLTKEEEKKEKEED